MHRLRLVLGNKPDWAPHIRARLGSAYEISPVLLDDCHAAWADVVVPLSLADYGVLRNNPGFRDKALLPSAPAVAICDDKAVFREWFKHRFDATFLPGQTAASRYSIAKPRRGEWGQRTFLIDNHNLAALAAVRADASMCLDDYVEGPVEFAHHMVFDRGAVVYSARARYQHSSPFYVRGQAYHPLPVAIELQADVPPVFVDMLRALGYSGTACIDYKLDATGHIRICEVNPRMGASLIADSDGYLAAYVQQVQARRQPGAGCVDS